MTTRHQMLRAPQLRRARSSRGFSLLELLLAMAMAAMLALSLYTAMNIALRARTSAAASLEPTRAALIAVGLVQHDFESVPPPAGVDTLRGTFYGVHGGAGVGNSDSIEFYTIGADPVAGDAADDGFGAQADAFPLAEGVRKIELYVSDDTASPALVRRVTRNLLPASEPQAEEEILCRNVRSFSLRYYDGIAWMEDWDSTTLDDTLPLAVSITIELGGPDAQSPGKRVTRVVPLPCATPAADDNALILGGAQ